MRKVNVKAIAMVAICLGSASVGRAAVLAGYDPQGRASNVTAAAVPLVAANVDANIAASAITRGAGINPAALANGFSSDNFYFAAGTPAVAGTRADALRENEYYQVTLTPAAGATASFATIDLNYRRSGNGPTNLEWQYSLDGFATAGTVLSSAAAVSNTDTGVAQAQVDLTGTPALQAVPSSTPVTFRLYQWGATTTAGTGAIGRLAGDDLVIGGSTAIPEPASIGSLALTGLLLLFARRRLTRRA